MNNNLKKEKKLFFSILVNLFITIVEIVGGILSNSMALISDAVHNLNDSISIVLSYIALKISKKSYNKLWTYGYKRVEILTAFVNSILLIVMVFFILYSTTKRIINKSDIHAELMLGVAIVGFLGNLISVILLHGEIKENINIRSAYLHLLGDTFSSIAVIIGAVIINMFGFLWVDILISISISIFILKEAYKILKQTFLILMQAVPSEINIEEIRNSLEKLDYVKNIHHVHIWNLNEREIHYECHVELVNDFNISKTDELTTKISKILLNNFGITHVTLQYEYNSCCDIRNLYNGCDTAYK